jgi:Putative adhesin
MTTMNRIWQGLMCVGVVALWQPPALGAAPLLTVADAEQPAPAAPATPPAPPVAPTPGRGPGSEVWSRERQARRDAERGPWIDSEAIVRQFKGGEGVTLDLLNMLGDIVVVGGKGREGRLSIVRRVQGRGPDTDALLKAFEIDVSEHANRVAVRSSLPRPSQPPPRGSRPRVRADYQIALPPGTALELKNMHGNVTLTNVVGDVRVEAMAGDVVGEALSRVRMLRSMSGDVMLSRSVVEGDANLQSVSGNVIASGVQAGSLTMGTVSGTVQIKESGSDRTLVRTVSGDIEFAAAPRKAGRYELKTHAGDIFVFAPRGSGFEFEANTFKGDVTSDVPTQPGMTGSRQVRGSVGDGSAFFELTSFTGDITVGKKQEKQK